MTTKTSLLTQKSPPQGSLRPKLNTQNLTVVVFTLGVVALLTGLWQVALVLIVLSALYTFVTADVYKLLLFMLIFTAFNALTMITTFNFMPVAGMKVLQVWREVLEIIILVRLIWQAPKRLWQIRLTALDLAVGFFILLHLVYFVLPIGLPGIFERVTALRLDLGHFLAFFVGRLIILTMRQKQLIILGLGGLGVLAGVVAFFDRFLVPESFLVKVLNYPRYYNNFGGLYPGRKADVLPPFYYYGGNIRRAGSFLLNPLEFYPFMLLAAALIMAWWLVSSPTQRKGWEIWAGAGFFLVVSGFILAFTRAAYPLMLLEFVVLGLLAGQARVRWALFGLSGLALAVFAVLLIFSATIRDITIKTVTFDESSSAEHLRRMIQGLDAFKDAPLGYGLGTGGGAGLRLGIGLGGESYYIAKLVDFGLIGVVAFLAVLMAMAWSGWQVFRRAQVGVDRILGLTLAVFTIQFALHSLVGEDFNLAVSTHYMFFLAGLAANWLAVSSGQWSVVSSTSKVQTTRL